MCWIPKPKLFILQKFNPRWGKWTRKLSEGYMLLIKISKNNIKTQKHVQQDHTSMPRNGPKSCKITFHISKSQCASVLPNHHGSLSSVECHLTKKKRISDVASTKTKTLGNLCKWNCKKKRCQEISKPASSGLPSQVTIPCFGIPGDVPRDLYIPTFGDKKIICRIASWWNILLPLKATMSLYRIKTFKFTRAASTLNFSKSDWLLWCHFYSTLHPLKKRWSEALLFMNKHIQYNLKN